MLGDEAHRSVPIANSDGNERVKVLIVGPHCARLQFHGMIPGRLFICYTCYTYSDGAFRAIDIVVRLGENIAIYVRPRRGAQER